MIRQDGADVQQMFSESIKNTTMEAEVSHKDTSSSVTDIAKPDLPQSRSMRSLTKDGHYFQRELDNTMGKLEELCNEYDPDAVRITFPDLSEDAEGRMRMAIGKAKLMITKRLPQFAGLITQNLNGTGESGLTVTDEDLAGFWDLVLLAVDDVLSKFERLGQIRSNNWSVEPSRPPSAVLRPKKKTTVRKSKLARAPNPELEARRKEQRKALKAAMKKQALEKKNSDDSVVIFMPSSPQVVHAPRRTSGSPTSSSLGKPPHTATSNPTSPSKRISIV